MAKGDYVKVVVRVGSVAETHRTDVSVQGRRLKAQVEKDSGISWLVVQELTRSGNLVNEARYQLSEVLLYQTSLSDD